MKITSITTEEFRWPRHTPIRNGKHKPGGSVTSRIVSWTCGLTPTAIVISASCPPGGLLSLGLTPMMVTGTPSIRRLWPINFRSRPNRRAQ